MTDLANQIEALSAAATFCMDHKLDGEAADQALMDKVWDNLPQIIAALREAEALRKQLPEEMRDCTIVFEECEKGHGHLRGTNWIKHPCQQCEAEALRARVAELEALEASCQHKRFHWDRSAEIYICDDCGDDAETFGLGAKPSTIKRLVDLSLLEKRDGRIWAKP